MSLLESGEKDLLRTIRAGENDIGLVVGPVLTEPDIVFEQMREEDYVVIALPDHPLANRESIPPSDIPKQEVIITQAGCKCRNLWEGLLGKLGIEYRIVCELSNFEAVKNCVLHGLGISFVPRSIVRQDVDGGRLAILPIDGLNVRLPFSFVYHNRKRLSPPVRFFIESLRS